MGQDIEKAVAKLAEMDRSELLARWEAEFGAPLHFRANVRLLRYGLAYRLQEKAYGGLKPATRRRLRQIASAVKEGRALPSLAPLTIKPGTRLVGGWVTETKEIPAAPKISTIFAKSASARVSRSTF